MENKSVYLLQHLGAPERESSELKEYCEIIKKAETHFGIKIYQQPFGQKEVADHTANRFFFHFSDYCCDDTKATRIGESVLLGIEIFYGPFGDLYNPDPVYAFWSNLFSEQGFVTKDELIRFEESKPYGQRAFEFPGELFNAQWVLPIHVQTAWKIARALYDNQNLFNGANFLKSSQEKYFVWPGQLNKVIGDMSIAKAGWEQTRLEDALFNAYKTVEAIIGDIPKDDRKYYVKLAKNGIDPHEIVGYNSKKEIHIVIRELNEERDKKTAHGKTPNRKIAIGSMLEYRACARFVLISAIEKYLEESIY